MYTSFYKRKSHKHSNDLTSMLRLLSVKSQNERERLLSIVDDWTEFDKYIIYSKFPQYLKLWSNKTRFEENLMMNPYWFSIFLRENYMQSDHAARRFYQKLCEKYMTSPYTTYALAVQIPELFKYCECQYKFKLDNKNGFLANKLINRHGYNIRSL